METIDHENRLLAESDEQHMLYGNLPQNTHEQFSTTHDSIQSSMTGNEENPVQYEGRKPRTCSQFLQPLGVLILLLLSLYTFLVVAVAPHISGWGTVELPATTPEIVNWSCFGLLWVLTVISLANMVFRTPGYVPNNYRFDRSKMNEVDEQIYYEMNLILHSTAQQQKDVFDNNGIVHGSFRQTALTMNVGSVLNLGASFVPQKAQNHFSDQDRNDGAQTQHASGGIFGDSSVQEGGLVYFQETEAEEVIRMSQFSRDFVLRDDDAEENDQRKSPLKKVSFQGSNVNSSQRSSKQSNPKSSQMTGTEWTELALPIVNEIIEEPANEEDHSSKSLNDQSNLSANIMSFDSKSNDSGVLSASAHPMMKQSSGPNKSSQSSPQSNPFGYGDSPSFDPRNKSSLSLSINDDDADDVQLLKLDPSTDKAQAHHSNDLVIKQSQQSLDVPSWPKLTQDQAKSAVSGRYESRVKQSSSDAVEFSSATTLQPIESQVQVTTEYKSPVISSNESTINPLKKPVAVQNKQYKASDEQVPVNMLLLSTNSSNGLTIKDYQVDYLRQKFLNNCNRCKCVKPPRTHHCSQCGRCVLRMDHHCRFVANCVGFHNMKFFLQFVFYLGVVSLYSAIIFATKGIQCAANMDLPACSGKPIHFLANVVVTTGTSISNLLVFAFVACLFANQLHLIKQNRSFIDNLQKRKNNFGIELELAQKFQNPDLVKFQQKTYFDKMAEIMGDRCILFWFLPIYRLKPQDIERELNQHFIS